MHRMAKPSARRRMNTNYSGTAGCETAWRKKNLTTCSCAAILMSRRRTWTFTMQISGAGQLWLRRVNERPFDNCAALAYTTHSESIIRKANSSPGGTIKCADLKEIAACALMPYWQAKVWLKTVLHPASIAKCALG